MAVTVEERCILMACDFILITSLMAYIWLKIKLIANAINNNRQKQPEDDDMLYYQMVPLKKTDQTSSRYMR